MPYGPAPDFQIAIDTHFRSSLTDAIDLYNNAREEALALLYRHKDLNATRPLEIEADFEEVAASCGHFSFSLQDFAEEISTYLDILDELKGEDNEDERRRSWTWLKFWRKNRNANQNGKDEDPGRPCFFSPQQSYLTRTQSRMY